MNEDVEIKWINGCNREGHATLHLNGVFPANVGFLKKILKRLVDLDHENKNEIINKMIDYCERQLPELEEKKKEVVKNYFDYMQIKADLTEPLSKQEKLVEKLEKYYRNEEAAIKKEKDKLKDLKEQYRNANKEIRQSLNQNKLYEKQIVLFQKDIQILEKRKG